MNIRCVFLALGIWVLSLSARANGADDRVYTYQDHPKVFGKNNISLSVSPLFASGYELNYDRRIKPKHWIKLAPIYYNRQNYNPSKLSSLRTVDGFGFKLQHKYFPYANTHDKIGFFLCYGPAFQRFDVETQNRKKLSFDKFAFECVIGGRRVFRNVFYVEVYAGMTSNYLKINDDNDDIASDILGSSKTKWYVAETLNASSNKMWYSYGKKGNFLTFGLNLGVLF